MHIEIRPIHSHTKITDTPLILLSVARSSLWTAAAEHQWLQPSSCSPPEHEQTRQGPDVIGDKQTSDARQKRDIDNGHLQLLVVLSRQLVQLIACGNSSAQKFRGALRLLKPRRNVS